MMTGGVAKNPGVVRAVERRLEPVLYICEEPEIVGAAGAALYALEKCGFCSGTGMREVLIQTGDTVVKIPVSQILYIEKSKIIWNIIPEIRYTGSGEPLPMWKMLSGKRLFQMYQRVPGKSKVCDKSF